jgi:hypothetical protein
MNESGSALDDTASATRRESTRGRTLLRLLLMVAFVVVALHIGSTLVDDARYFASRAPLVDLGRAEELDYATLRADTYVRVTGITTNRAAQADRGIWPMRQRVRYYLLAGSRVLLQTEAGLNNAKTSEVYTEIAAEGRLLRLRPGSDLDPIVEYFSRQFGYDFAARDYWLVVAGAAPGTQWRYPLTLVALAALVCLNLVAMARSVRRPRRGTPTDGAPT